MALPNKPFVSHVTRPKKKTHLSVGLFLWCKIVDALQTSAISATNDYKLKHLAEVFQLSGNLLDA